MAIANLNLNLPVFPERLCCGEDDCNNQVQNAQIPRILAGRDVIAILDSAWEEPFPCPINSCLGEEVNNILIVEINDIRKYDKFTFKPTACLEGEVFDIYITEDFTTNEEGLNILVNKINTIYTTIRAEIIYGTNRIRLFLSPVIYPCGENINICTSGCISPPEIEIITDDILFPINVSMQECDSCGIGILNIDVTVAPYYINISIDNVEDNSCTFCDDLIEGITYRIRPMQTGTVSIQILDTAVPPFAIFIDNIFQGTIVTYRADFPISEGNHTIRVESVDIPNCFDIDYIDVSSDPCDECGLNLGWTGGNTISIVTSGTCVGSTDFDYKLVNDTTDNVGYTGQLVYEGGNNYSFPDIISSGINTLTIYTNGVPTGCTTEAVINIILNEACLNTTCKQFEYLQFTEQALITYFAQVPTADMQNIVNAVNNLNPDEYLEDVLYAYLPIEDRNRYRQLHDNNCFHVKLQVFFDDNTNKEIVAVATYPTINSAADNVQLLGMCIIPPIIQSTSYYMGTINSPNVMGSELGTIPLGTSANTCNLSIAAPWELGDVSDSCTLYLACNGYEAVPVSSRKTKTHYVGRGLVIVAFDSFYATNKFNIYKGSISQQNIDSGLGIPIILNQFNSTYPESKQEGVFYFNLTTHDFITIDLYSNSYYKVFCANTSQSHEGIFEFGLPYTISPDPFAYTQLAEPYIRYQWVDAFVLQAPTTQIGVRTATLDWTYLLNNLDLWNVDLGFRYTMFKLPHSALMLPNSVVNYHRGNMINTGNAPVIGGVTQNSNPFNSLTHGIVHQTCNIPSTINRICDSTGYRVAHSNGYSYPTPTAMIRSQFVNVDSSVWELSNQDGQIAGNNGKLRIGNVAAGEQIVIIITSDEWYGGQMGPTPPFAVSSSYIGNDNFKTGHNFPGVNCSALNTYVGGFDGSGNHIDFTGLVQIRLEANLI